MNKICSVKLFLFFLTFIAINPLFSQITVDIETGAVFSGYNNVRIPGDTGTKFSLSEELSIDPSAFIRARVFASLGGRHNIGVLLAPLSLYSEGKLDRDLAFQGKTFTAGAHLKGLFKFNSWRVVYRYDWVKKPSFEFGIGFTAKIRDAEIKISGDGQEASKTDLGFVPIIHFRLHWKAGERLGFLLEGDALAAPQGRAADVLAALTCRVNKSMQLKAGYRILEGGADNDTVYNFALLHYATAGLILTF